MPPRQLKNTRGMAKGKSLASGKSVGPIFVDLEKNFTDISSMQQSSVRLSLLGLPTEIRLKIWEYVLGNQTVYIIFPGTTRGQRRKGFPVDRLAGVFRHTLCIAEVSCGAAYVLPICEKVLLAESEPSWEHPPVFDTRISGNRHHNCFVRPGRGWVFPRKL